MKMWIDSWADNWVSVKWDHALGKYMLSIHCGGKTEYKVFNQILLDQLISEYNLWNEDVTKLLYKKTF